jgi:branched-chain amino acid transport system ATP-binding protein
LTLPSLLQVEGLTVAYGKAEVVHGISFTVGAGEFVTLLGRNGAGKSTVLHALSGLIPKRSGRILLGDVDLSDADPLRIVKAGIIQVLEGHRIFGRLSVEDNLLLGTIVNHPRGNPEQLANIYDLFPELRERRREPAAALSGGQQQILAVAQGVIGEPKLLILDELSSGLAPLVIDTILSVIKRLADGGVAILLVEQLVEKALHYAHRAYVLDAGRIVGSGTPAEIYEQNTLRTAYLGAAHS